MLAEMFWVMLGGALGAVWRTLCIRILQTFLNLKSLMALLLVNILGCFLAGLFLRIAYLNQNVIEGVLISFGIVGFLGSYTSVSAFGLETFLLIAQRRIWAALGYVLACLTFCMGGFVVGWGTL